MKKLLSLVTAIMIAATTFAQEATVTTIGTGILPDYLYLHRRILLLLLCR